MLCRKASYRWVYAANAPKRKLFLFTIYFLFNYNFVNLYLVIHNSSFIPIKTNSNRFCGLSPFGGSGAIS